MKRRSAKRDHWTRVTHKTFRKGYVDEPRFKGYVCTVELLEVSSPLWVTCCGQKICVADSGYAWVQYFPEGEPHALTAMYDSSGNLVQWYIDICLHGLDESGVPYWDDLYVDIVGLPPTQFELIDAEELEAALSSGAVTQAQYDLAWEEARRLSWRLEAREYPLLDFVLMSFSRVPSDA